MAANFTLATQLGLWRLQSKQDVLATRSVLEALVGDTQRLFANHFLTKADVYLHSGVYPSIFDQARSNRKSHLSDAAGAASEGLGHEEHEETNSADHQHRHDAHEEDEVSELPNAPQDWIARFGRNFYPTRHTHLDPAEQKEILPWLRLAADLNPNEVETYTVGAYWLRRRMGKVKEAEDFLREGWRANPNSFEILFELGRLFQENRHDSLRARNLFELALRKWNTSEPGKADPDNFTYMQITAHLARLEEEERHFEKAITYLKLLQKVSPHPDKIQEQISELQLKAGRSLADGKR
jgi:tetratricopeptide (TPR) repeat protein